MGDHAVELLNVLFPCLSQVVVDSVVRIGKSVRIRARCTVPAARCSECGTVSARVHSRYGRRLADGAAGGQETAIDLEVRRFFCDNTACTKRTIGLQRLLEQVALALGGRAGERLAAHLAAPVSGSTLLRLIHRLDLPPIPEVQVLGVDEFAFHRGRKFGAILVDMASSRPVDVLPDHTADTFAAWLRDHQHVKMICRDRGGAFADGVNRALPGIPQVADRWHLLHNLATAVEKTVRRHRTCLKQAGPEPEEGTPTPPRRHALSSRPVPAGRRSAPSTRTV